MIPYLRRKKILEALEVKELLYLGGILPNCWRTHHRRPFAAI